MKEYIVTKEILNIRSKPTDATEDTYAGYLNRGASIFLDAREVTGTKPQGGETEIWKPYNRDYFLAKDGVRLKNYADRKEEFVNDPFNAKYIDVNDKYNEDKWKVNWGIVDLEIWKIWRDYGTQGEGVRVAVIDTGVTTEHNDLKDRISSLSASVISNSLNDNSNSKHGTMSAGLIGANGMNVSSVIGVAPKCELVIIKAGENAFFPSNILLAVKKAQDLNVDILSISIEYYFDIEGMKDVILACQTAGILLFAAVGDLGDASVSYPASYQGCFSVGAYSLTDGKQRVVNPVNNKNEFLKFLCPGNGLLTCSTTSIPTKFSASSAATAFASGMMALVVAATTDKKPNFPGVMNGLKSKLCTNSITGNEVPSNAEGYGVVNPMQLIKYLISNT